MKGDLLLGPVYMAREALARPYRTASSPTSFRYGLDTPPLYHTLYSRTSPPLVGPQNWGMMAGW
jgi:hypothetical protein